MANKTDTIAAVASPPGRGGVGVVRVSGPDVPAIMASVCKVPLKPRLATLCRFRDAHDGVIDEGLAIYFAAPHSFTGEDVLELQGHGGPVVMDLIMTRLVELGVRVAKPGEFSLRAFLNDRIDLNQAEAIADLIDSRTAAAARAAQRAIAGEFSQSIAKLSEAIVNVRVWIEAAIDFPEEEIDFLADSELATELQALRPLVHDVLHKANRGCAAERRNHSGDRRPAQRREVQSAKRNDGNRDGDRDGGTGHHPRHIASDRANRWDTRQHD